MRKALAPILIIAILGTLGIFQRDVLGDICARLIALPRISLVPLACAAFVMVCARGFFLLACSPGISLRQAIMTDQAALAAGYMMAGSRAQRTLETTTYTTVCYFVCAITALPIALLSGNQMFNYSAREWWILIGLIAGAQILGHTKFNSALKRVSPAIVSLIVFFEVPVSSLLAVWWMGQKPPIGIIPGILLILIGCALVVIRGRESND